MLGDRAVTRRLTTPFAALLALSLACSPSPAPPSPSPRAPLPAAPPPILPPSPARYVATESMGAQFDEAGAASALPKPEPALLDGSRALAFGGVVLASAKSPEYLTGFRSLPARLGGGYLLWSTSATFRAGDFLGELTPVAPAGATGGARPWLSGVILRTDRGLFELDPTSLALKRFNAPGIVDGLAIDARRAARLDAVGRASFTADGGATWTDVLSERGFSTLSLREGEDGAIELTGLSGRPAFRLTSSGTTLEPIDDQTSFNRSRRFASPTFYEPPGLDSPSSRSLAPDLAAHAAGAGALLPGGLAIVGKPRGFAILSASTARPLAEVELTMVAEHLTRCQPFVAAAPAHPSGPSGAVLLLCSHNRGAHVLRLERDMASPALEATFPDPGVFVTGERGRVAFAGRCGRTPPSSTDFRAEGAPRPGEGEGANEELLRQMQTPPEGSENVPAPPPEEPPPSGEPPAREPPLDDIARVCVRAPGGHWIERHLRGSDAHRLYRFLPGDDGTATAILFRADAPASPKPDASARSSEGVRVVDVDPGDAALDRGLFPALLVPSGEPPIRSADPDFWLSDDGSIRGWVDHRSPDDAEPPSEEPPSEGSTPPPKRSLPVSHRSGGRVGGVRIDPTGKVTLYPLPPDTEHVVHGGRFGLAMALRDDVASYFETTDGGRSWQPVEGPPVGRMEVPYEGGPPFACSPLGCVVGGAVLRLGWGGPLPTPAPVDSDPPRPKGPASPIPEPLSPPVLTCRYEGAGEPWASPAAPRGPSVKAQAKPPAPLSILSSGPLGSHRDGMWSAEVIPPFSPSVSARRVSVRVSSLGSAHGFIAPILSSGGTKAPVDLLLLADKRRLRLLTSGPLSFLPFEQGSRVTALADLPGGDLIALDADRGVLSLVPAVYPARPALRFARISDAARTRLTLARAISGGGLALVGYSAISGEVFAGALDLGRAEVGPLRALGSLRTLGAAGLGACGGSPGAYRFLMELPVDVRVSDGSGREVIRGNSFAVMRISASGERLCAEGVEAKLPRGEPWLLVSAVFDRPAAVIRSAGGSVPVTCSLENHGD